MPNVPCGRHAEESYYRGSREGADHPQKGATLVLTGDVKRDF